MIINRLINIKLSEEEVDRLLDGLFVKPDRCPCQILGRDCNMCKYKTIDEKTEGRHSSGCIDAVEYFIMKSTIEYFTRWNKGTESWNRLLYYALINAFPLDSKQRKRVEKKWVF